MLIFMNIMDNFVSEMSDAIHCDVFVAIIY